MAKFGIGTKLTSGTIDHGLVSGLDGDDHLQYLRVDGTRNGTGANQAFDGNLSCVDVTGSGDILLTGEDATITSGFSTSALKFVSSNVGGAINGPAIIFDTANTLTSVADRIVQFNNNTTKVMAVDKDGNFETSGYKYAFGNGSSANEFVLQTPLTEGVLIYNSIVGSGTGVKTTPLGAAYGNGHIESVNAFAKNFVIGTGDGRGVKLNSVLDWSPDASNHQTMDLGISGTAEWDNLFMSGNATIGGNLSCVDVTTTGKRILATALSSNTTYAVGTVDHVVFLDTTSNAITCTLPTGAEGRTLKIINSGTSGYALTVAPNGSELLIGANSNFLLYDGETLELTYNATEGWY